MPPKFDPAAMLGVLAAHGVDCIVIGGFAAVAHGAPHITFDVDVVPSRSPDSLERLARALVDLDARIRTEGAEGGLQFDRSAAMLRSVSILNLTTKFGDLDLTFTPAGTTGFEDLRRNAVHVTVQGTSVLVAALADVIRSKEAANREKDRAALPALRKLAEMIRERS